jgi:recombination protein RecA
MSSDGSDSLRAFISRARAGSAAVNGVRALALSSEHPALAERQLVQAGPRWHLDELTGRLVELSGMGAVASLTAAVALLLEAQERGEPAAWIGLYGAAFFPPDLDDAGVDLDAVVVVRVPDAMVMARAADRVLRSGAFGLVFLDLGGAGSAGIEIPVAVQGRLVGLAQHHDAAIVAITEKPNDAASIGSMVSLRAAAVRERIGGGKPGFKIAVRAVKDKRRGPGWFQELDVLGPAGLV